MANTSRGGRVPVKNRTRRDPAYLRIERHLRALLDAGAGVSEPMPSEVDLAREFEVSIMTVRQAYTRLVNAGVVRRMPFRGTWAVTHITDDLGQQGGRAYPEAWLSQAHEVHAEVLVFEERVAPDNVANRFRVPTGTRLIYLERLRRANGQPIAWDVRWLPLKVRDSVTRADFEGEAVFRIMERSGFPATIMQSDVTARAADARLADLLSVPLGSPILVRDSTALDSAGQTVLVSSSHYPGERYTFRSSTVVITS
ncbi:MAG TPA: GntR family transcriptional regulator [Lacisediminihabitans sp.]|uniref:GntR family transcriptional regulator n=1 Tax=Lacisediminihabitans sp. TaxID=2787631 RepID=UPI002ED87B60